MAERTTPTRFETYLHKESKQRAENPSPGIEGAIDDAAFGIARTGADWIQAGIDNSDSIIDGVKGIGGAVVDGIGTAMNNPGDAIGGAMGLVSDILTPNMEATGIEEARLPRGGGCRHRADRSICRHARRGAAGDDGGHTV